ncbi:hypothetical protein DPMN_134272 [Dreissena polymorpha]|uniref:G-protein coupled receptors family 1 profile domain-containing protein n=1 Tax=Dreissena polymorpha TaxID=45954 RepID=A0A9D4FWX2_DREPO|nr:hypothetical protein DPMN_134272 [Dreissena polymorpha]
MYGNEYYDLETGGDDYYDVYYLTLFDFEVITLGRVRPIIILVVALANIFVVSYFLADKRRGKPTNLLFVSIAFSDTMTGIALLPNSFNVYIPNNDKLSAVACNTFMVWKFYIAIAFHTASIWQTVFLGIQRYLCVCHPLIFGRICTFWKTMVAIIVIYILSFLMHIYQLINVITHNYTNSHECEWRADYPCKNACLYMWICVIFQHFLPVFLLIGLTIQTLISLHKAHRQASLNMSDKVNKIRRSKERIITITAVLIVICFLVPDVPYGIYKLYVLIGIYRPTSVKLDVETHHIMSSAYEIALLVSFHVLFWIYCTMISDFRRALIHVFTFMCFKRDCVKRHQSLNSYQRTFLTNGFGSSRTLTDSGIGENTDHIPLMGINSTTSEKIHAVDQKILRPMSTKESDQPVCSTAYSKQTSV